MLKFIQNNREITALLAVVLLFVLPGFLDRQYLSVQTLTMVYSSAQMTQIDSVLVLLRIPAWWNDFIAGMVLLAVLVFDGRLRCALERNLRRQKYARFMMPPPSVKPASSGKKREAA
ncbi:hypothetical protein AACI26_003728 [Escherichia coli]